MWKSVLQENDANCSLAQTTVLCANNIREYYNYIIRIIYLKNLVCDLLSNKDVMGLGFRVDLFWWTNEYDIFDIK